MARQWQATAFKLKTLLFDSLQQTLLWGGFVDARTYAH